MLEVYRRPVLEGMGRLLSRLDRRVWSPTFGCFDREYWHYKTLLDFPRAVFQQSVLALMLLYRSPFPGNDFAGNPRVLQWVQAAISFWAAARNRDGSANEWYLNERSFCATAYTTYAVSETLLQGWDDFPEEFRRTARDELRASVSWLAAHRNDLVANQMAASLVAIYNMFRLTQEPEYKLAYESRRRELMAMQHAEAWFKEYDGCDIGYSFLTLDLLAHLSHVTRDEQLTDAVDKLADFLVYFMRSDGSVPGHYGSRSTDHCFPYGLELLGAKQNPNAGWMLRNVRNALAASRAPSPLSVDDTYCAYFYINSFCQAGLVAEPSIGGSAPRFPRRKFFSGAGLFVYETENYHAIVSSRNGAWAVQDSDGRIGGDSGYVARTSTDTYTTQGTGQGTASQVKEHGQVCVAELLIPFQKLDTSLPLTKYMAPFKLFSQYALSIPALSMVFSRLIKNLKIRRAVKGLGNLRRTFRLDARGVQVEDKIQLTTSRSVVALHRALPPSASAYSPSSLMFTFDTLVVDTDPRCDPQAAGSRLSAEGSLQLDMTFVANVGRQ